MALFQAFDWSGIFHRFLALLGPFGKVITAMIDVFDRLRLLVPRSRKLIDDTVVEFGQWKHFRLDKRFSNRVVNIERAIAKSQDLIDGAAAAWQSIQDIVTKMKKPAEKAGKETETAVEDVNQARSITEFLERFPRVANGLAALISALKVVAEFLESYSTILDDLQQILDEITRLRLAIENLDTIFLSQTNPRKRVRLADGTLLRIRIGNLHTADV